MKVIGKNTACTHSYLIINPCESKETCDNILKYLNTKFVRYLLLQAMSSIHITSSTFVFVPEQNFDSNSDIDWSLSISDINEQLYKKYNLSINEIENIESKIKEM